MATMRKQRNPRRVYKVRLNHARGGQNWQRPWGHMFYIRMSYETLKILLFGTNRHIALIFGMQHQKEVLHKVCLQKFEMRSTLNMTTGQ